jgi:hypothetical protein
VGVVGANILLSTIDQLIATFVSEAGKEFVAFVVDDKGLMISSSVDGLVLVSESGVRISALDCTNAVIADVASRILVRTLPIIELFSDVDQILFNDVRIQISVVTARLMTQSTRSRSKIEEFSGFNVEL